MKRLLWLGVGLAVGALVVRKIDPEGAGVHPVGHRRLGCRNPLAAWSSRCVDFVDDVRDGMAEREEQIHEAFADGVAFDDQFADLRDDPQDRRTGAACRGRSPMRTAEIKRRFLAHFEANGHTVVPSAPLPAIDDPNLLFINAGMVQFVPYFLGQRDAAVPAGGQRAEVHPHAGHRRGRQDQPARHVLPDERQLLLRRLLQGRRDPARLGAGHQAGRRGRLRPRPGADLGDGLPRRRRGDRDLAARPACPPERIVRRGKEDNFWSMGIPGPAARARRSTTTAAPSTGPRAARRSTRTATWSSGTSSSCSTRSPT